MRVISGIYRGRRIISPKGENIRPTSDRVKENLFNIIATHIEGSVCLDLFGGTGALGIEAVSRGAKITYIVDNDKNSFKNIQLNSRDIVSIVPILSDYSLALKNFAHKNMKFDIIFIDPPYETRLGELAISKIEELGLLSEEGIIVWENLSRLEKSKKFKTQLEIYDERKYGEVSLTFLKRK
jgi:16S rRNA (guanine(966)-N(2))-methyltransferase RsmD